MPTPVVTRTIPVDLSADLGDPVDDATDHESDDWPDDELDELDNDRELLDDLDERYLWLLFKPEPEPDPDPGPDDLDLVTPVALDEGIPSAVVVGFGRWYRILAFDDTSGQTTAGGLPLSDLDGWCSWRKRRIWMRAGLPPGYRHEVLLHEVLHAIDREASSGMGEELIKVVSPVLLDVLRSNPELIRLITGGQPLRHGSKPGRRSRARPCCGCRGRATRPP
jgi:hypothetical protein